MKTKLIAAFLFFTMASVCFCKDETEALGSSGYKVNNQEAIAASIFTDDNTIDFDNLPPVECLKKVAMNLGLMEEGEYYFTHETYVFMDLDSMRERYQISKTAPPLEDSKRFPSDSETIRNAVKVNREYLEYLKAAEPLDRINKKWYEDTINETNELFEFWNQLDDLHTYSSSNKWHQRSCLKEIKRILGDENYNAGKCPPPVPYWRFRELK